jgi:hypothetical protein
MFHSPEPLELLSLFISLLSLAVSFTTYWFVREAMREVVRLTKRKKRRKKKVTWPAISEALDLLRELDRREREQHELDCPTYSGPSTGFQSDLWKRQGPTTRGQR